MKTDSKKDLSIPTAIKRNEHERSGKNVTHAASVQHTTAFTKVQAIRRQQTLQRFVRVDSFHTINYKGIL